MKKAINILVLISKILSLALGALYLTLAIIAFVHCFTEPSADLGGNIGEMLGRLFSLSFCVYAAYLSWTKEPSLQGEGDKTTVDSILSIVFGLLSGTVTLAAAGVVALVLKSVNEEKKEADVIDEPKDEE